MAKLNQIQTSSPPPSSTSNQRKPLHTDRRGAAGWYLVDWRTKESWHKRRSLANQEVRGAGGRPPLPFEERAQLGQEAGGAFAVPERRSPIWRAGGRNSRPAGSETGAPVPGRNAPAVVIARNGFRRKMIWSAAGKNFSVKTSPEQTFTCTPQGLP